MPFFPKISEQLDYYETGGGGIYLPLAGGIMSGNIDMGGNDITNVLNISGTPLLEISAQDLTLISINNLRLESGVSGFRTEINLDNLTNNRILTIPDASGVLALVSNLSAYLPLAGGTMSGNINMGNNNINSVSSISTTGLDNSASTNNILARSLDTSPIFRLTNSGQFIVYNNIYFNGNASSNLLWDPANGVLHGTGGLERIDLPNCTLYYLGLIQLDWQNHKLNDNWAIGTSAPTPTAYLHFAAGTATANTAPLKFTLGTNLTTPEAGTIEYNGTKFFNTNSTAVRGTFLDIRTLVSGAGTLSLNTTYTHYVFTGTTTTWTLDPITGNTNTSIFIKNRGSGAITLNTNAGASEIYSTSAVATISIAAGSAIILINDGTYWNVE